MMPKHSSRCGKLAKVELAIAIGQEDEVHGGSVEPRTDGRPVSAIAEMRHDRQLGDPALQRAEDPGGVIGAAVVHDDDLQLGGQPSTHFGRLADHPGDVALLVETGNHHGKSHPRDA